MEIMLFGTDLIQAMASMASASGMNPLLEQSKSIRITPELEEIMKRVSDLKNVAGMVVVNSEGIFGGGGKIDRTLELKISNHMLLDFLRNMCSTIKLECSY